MSRMQHFARKYPDLVFEISGHTDSIGTENLPLSLNRAQSVFQYLTEEHKIPTFRFYTLAMGSKHPFRPNQTEACRTLNRRADIRQSGLDVSNMFYRNALRAVEKKEYAQAFSFLHKWLIKPSKGDSGRRIMLLFDLRFEVLKKDKRWSTVDQKVRAEYRSFKYERYAFLLDSMRFDELIVNGRLNAMGHQGGLNALPGYIPELDTVLLELPIQPETVLQKKYEQHLAALLPILGKTGWPKKSEFGETASNSAFTMLLQSREILTQLKWLPALQKSCEEGETPWLHYAKLYDHCNLALGKPQRYCTQVLMLENGALEVPTWEGNVDTVNNQRAKIGLPLLSLAVADAMAEKQ